MGNKKNVKYIALFSGGKDSVAMTDLLLKNNYPVDYIVFNDTSIEFDLMYEYIKKVDLYFQKKYNKSITTIEPIIEFKEHLLGRRKRGKNVGRVRGFFTPSVSFCDIRRENKEKSFKRWLKKNKIQEHIKYIGFTREESNRAERFKKVFPNTIFPLIEYFDMTEKDCLEYLKKINLENPLYKYFNRTGCKFCHYQSDRDWYNIWKYFPKEWQELKEIEKQIMQTDTENKTIFLKYRTTNDMEKLFKKWDMQKTLF